MPIYVYRCKKCNNKFEEIQKFSDPPLTECRAIADGPIPYSCDGELEKLSANKTSFHFAGPGWEKDSYHNPWGQGNKTFEDTTRPCSPVTPPKTVVPYCPVGGLTPHKAGSPT